ncbi:hypothetical protein EPT55_07635 [Fusobacterium necrophorum]|uniref:hypothetical protein n=1 Tax=Fusobacterium necrophorum TaxID=859 RepID=UPI001012BA70|nr:hypothetical protein [Fusobacterium necrophorum]RXZ26885.1 hypothetical protein EPT55_07635 [Fusobacterium necrophorum]
MTKRELKKKLKDKKTKIICLKDYDFEVSRYGREQKSNFELNEVQREILLNMYKQFPQYFFINSENTFSNDEQKYMLV